MTTLVNTSNKGPSGKKKGRSKKAHVLAVSVEQATQNFLEKGEQIAKDSHDLKEELIAAVEDVRKQGMLWCSYSAYLCTVVNERWPDNCFKVSHNSDCFSFHCEISTVVITFSALNYVNVCDLVVVI